MRSAFTLVEILVVLAIIGILAAILLPVFANVREGARVAQCSNNLRQIGMGIAQYMSDNDRRFPPDFEMRPHCAWMDRVLRYVKQPEVFLCPSHEEALYEFGSNCSGSERRLNGSYAVNFLGQGIPDGLAKQYIHESRFNHPATTITVVDGAGNFSFTNPAALAAIDAESLRTAGVADRHNGAVNALFADGHVKRMEMDALADRSIWLIGHRPLGTPGA